MDSNVESTNINTKWLDNIYENLKKIEEFERYAREGCASIMEYMQIPIQTRKIIVADIQYKNLRLLFNEMLLVVPDLKPVVDDEKDKEIKTLLERIKTIINNRNILIKEEYSEQKRTIINSYRMQL